MVDVTEELGPADTWDESTWQSSCSRQLHTMVIGKCYV
jgi:hypothetical protein